MIRCFLIRPFKILTLRGWRVPYVLDRKEKETKKGEKKRKRNEKLKQNLAASFILALPKVAALCTRKRERKKETHTYKESERESVC